jgi:hypothetical protein
LMAGTREVLAVIWEGILVSGDILTSSAIAYRIFA